MSGITSRSCNMGSPPVISINPPLGLRRAISLSTSSMVILLPP